MRLGPLLAVLSQPAQSLSLRRAAPPHAPMAPTEPDASGPNGAAVIRKPVPVYRARPAVTCAHGVYRAGCVGPNGAAVVRKPY